MICHLLGAMATVDATGMQLIVEEKPVCSLAKRPRLEGQCKGEADGSVALEDTSRRE
jgi:hypothetical protein